MQQDLAMQRPSVEEVIAGGMKERRDCAVGLFFVLLRLCLPTFDCCKSGVTTHGT